MKKTELLNSEISYIISRMGHTDMLVIADCGLPVPFETERIDLALKRGVPGFIETLKTVLTELVVEEIILAEEIKSMNKPVFEEIEKIFPDIKINFVSHEEFKDITREAAAVIRTGEASPYANIILKSGVKF
jgi:D-ribose pyranase